MFTESRTKGFLLFTHTIGYSCLTKAFSDASETVLVANVNSQTLCVWKHLLLRAPRGKCSSLISVGFSILIAIFLMTSQVDRKRNTNINKIISFNNKDDMKLHK